MSAPKCFLYLFISLSFIGAWLANYHYTYATLWLLFLIPAVSIVLLSPTWRTTLGAWSGVIIVLVATESSIYFKGHISFEGFQRLIISVLVGGVLFIFMSYLVIRNAKLTKELEQFALTDPLTKAYNRRYFDLYIQHNDDLLKKRDNQLAVIIFDIDHFKTINDTYGHNVGDIILKRLTRIVKEVIRDEGTLIRFGGEEFIIILPNSSLEKGYALAERIRMVVHFSSFKNKNQRIPVTISLGVAQCNGEQDFNDLIDKADQALYRAKENGRNQAVVEE